MIPVHRHERSTTADDGLFPDYFSVCRLTEDNRSRSVGGDGRLERERGTVRKMDAAGMRRCAAWRRDLHTRAVGTYMWLVIMFWSIVPRVTPSMARFTTAPVVCDGHGHNGSILLFGLAK